MVPLTEQLEITSASHILYIYENTDYYIENMLAYIKAGIAQEDHIVIIENPTIFKKIVYRLNGLFSRQQRELIHYIDNYSFYQCYGNFHTLSILNHFNELVDPFLNNNTVRTWGHVEWKKQENIFNKLEKYERLVDYDVNEMGLMSVCAYDASSVSAALQTSMMRSHEYLMTDKELVRSSLYGYVSLSK
ncbi:MEDS: MEthanogen/methylotroph, DcmR Sensory domain [Oceanobacillus limi]|uniref:MEDS: MEthanogen/methylotroph, DcmR Sensory domain n=1 Tax=Oceanobacillus limi TaxID=930131 RepID=A0A1I0CHW2_9BACI|nr:MEDS domain-containing protein [Oceanobacillus limi]SET19186.1 MEDS: MEthanogen/methylotroph, DcmR Sensory domain [Oceanobacillus limi]